MSAYLLMNGSTDYVEVQVYQNSGGASTLCRFQVHDVVGQVRHVTRPVMLGPYLCHGIPV